jgi:hypothetical protein
MPERTGVMKRIAESSGLFCRPVQQAPVLFYFLAVNCVIIKKNQSGKGVENKND